MFRTLVSLQLMIGNLYTRRGFNFIKLMNRDDFENKVALQGFKRASFEIRRKFGNNSTKDYHKILGVPLTATKKEIKSAYIKLAKKHHPDANPEDVHANIRFQEISDAYEALINDKKPQSHPPFKTSPKYESSSFTQAQKEYQERYGAPWHKSYEWTSMYKPDNFTLPPNVRIRDVFKQIIIDQGFENSVKNWDKAVADAKIAFKAGLRGDWEKVGLFAQDHGIVTICFAVSLASVLFFPWMINVIIFFLWYVYYLFLFIIGFILVFGHSPTFVIFVLKPLHTRFMMKAQKAYKRKQGS